MLTDDSKATLLKLAREAIIAIVRDGEIPPIDIPGPNLLERQGCFVTITIDHKLRGCIGNFISDKPLYELVREMAISAATKDPRFHPMKAEELRNFNVEISVLSPLQKISNTDEIEVGVHGIYIEKNFCRGVLLPQVAVEYKWDRDTFLRQTCLKAGLRQDDWRDGADIYIFSAQIFS